MFNWLMNMLKSNSVATANATLLILNKLKHVERILHRLSSDIYIEYYGAAGVWIHTGSNVTSEVAASLKLKPCLRVATGNSGTLTS